MVREDPEARRGEQLPGVAFSREARAEEILAGYRPELEAKGFRLGVLTGEPQGRSG
jgi:hypothetical protein